MRTKSTGAISSKSLALLESISGKKLTMGNFLWSIRECEEESLTAFAEKLGVSRQYLSDLEHGRRGLSPKMARQFAKLLGYPEKQFVRLSLQDQLDRQGVNLFVDIKDAA